LQFLLLNKANYTVLDNLFVKFFFLPHEDGEGGANAPDGGILLRIYINQILPMIKSTTRSKI